MEQPTRAKTPKNIAICCDGTGNQYGYDNSNVVKLYTCLTENAEPALLLSSRGWHYGRLAQHHLARQKNLHDRRPRFRHGLHR